MKPLTQYTYLNTCLTVIGVLQTAVRTPPLAGAQWQLHIGVSVKWCCFYDFRTRYLSLAMAQYRRWAFAMAVMTMCSLSSFYVPLFSDFSGLDSSGNTLLGFIPKVIKAKIEGAGYPATASRLFQGRRMMSLTHQESKYREPVRSCHSSDPAHSDPGNSPGKLNL